MKLLILFSLMIAGFTIAGPYHPAIEYIFPLPDSDRLSTQTTIIVRLHDEYQDQIIDLDNFIWVDGLDDAYLGRTFIAADGRTIIFDPRDDFLLNEDIRVTVRTSQFLDADFEYYFVTAPNSSPDDSRPRNLGKPHTVHQPQANGAPPVRKLNGVAVPADFPRIETNVYGETAPGRIFYATNYPDESTGNYAIILENDGTPYFYRKYPHVVRSGNFLVHPTGQLTVHFYFDWLYVVMDEQFTHVDTLRAGHGYETDNHECQILENGHVLIIGRDRLKMDMSEIVGGGRKDATVEAHHFQELDGDGNVIFEWRSWDHLDIRNSDISLTGSFIDWVHMNSIAIDYDENYVIHCRDVNTILKINRDTGEAMWRLNGDTNEFTFLNDRLRPAFPHDFRPIPGKPNHYTLFDNGRWRNPQFSRAVEYKIDPGAKTVETVWQYRHDPDIFSGYMGSAQRLPNGNTFIDWPHGMLHATEVTPDGEKVFELTSRGHKNYRCRRFEWDGMLPKPELLLENYSSIIRLIFNKFGDPNVGHYNIFVGHAGGELKKIATTADTYFDINALELENHQTYVFAVTAVSLDGEETAFSNREQAQINYIAEGQNAIKNGDFDLAGSSWIFNLQNNAAARARVTDDGEFKIAIGNTGSRFSDIQLKQENIMLLHGMDYVIEFDAYSDRSRAIDAKVESSSPPYTNFGDIGLTRLSNRKQHFRYEFRMDVSSQTDTRVVFNCGQLDGPVYIDNVSLTYRNPYTDSTDADVIRVNFQTPEAPVPDGYIADTGEPFGDRHGFSFGWLAGENGESRYRQQHNDLRYDTLNHLLKNEENQIWEIAVPDGSYQVRLVLGDAGYTDQINHVLLEGVRLEDSDGEDNFDVFETSVTVNDGRLTLEAAADALNTKICFIDIQSSIDSVEQNPAAPQAFELRQNYPNPFNSSTSIDFDLPSETHITLTLYDLLGRTIRTLADGRRTAGQHSLIWDGTDDAGRAVSSGVYLYQLRIGDGALLQRKLVLIR